MYLLYLLTFYQWHLFFYSRINEYNYNKEDDALKKKHRNMNRAHEKEFSMSLNESQGNDCAEICFIYFLFFYFS